MRRFIEDVTQLGLELRLEAELVIYSVQPVDGARAGLEVETAVAAAELTRWPQVPPHWIHLPRDVNFPRTNSRPSPRSGWLMHSRQISGWGRDADPARGWLAHVRSVVDQATS